MGDYYMTKKGAKKYKKTLLITTPNLALAEAKVRRALEVGAKNIELKKGTKEFRNGRFTVYRVYIKREG